MHEYVGAVRGGDEPVALFGIEPLDRADCHGVLLATKNAGKPRRAGVPRCDHATGIMALSNGHCETSWRFCTRTGTPGRACGTRPRSVSTPSRRAGSTQPIRYPDLRACTRTVPGPAQSSASPSPVSTDCGQV